MRMLTGALTLMLSATVLMAANPFSGKWKMNHKKSEQATADSSLERFDQQEREGR